MRPGIYENLPDHKYRDLPFLNWSRLKLVLDCPAKAKHYSDYGGGVITEPMRRGTRIHTAVLESSKWNETYKIKPDIEKQEVSFAKGPGGWMCTHPKGTLGPYKTKREAQDVAPLYTFYGADQGWPKAADAKAAMAEIYDGFTLITREQHDHAMDTAQAVFSHKASADFLFSKVQTELTFVWVENIDGHEILCKGRADGYSRTGKLMIDLKTCKDSTLWGFSKDAFYRKYHAQLAFYARGLEKASKQSGQLIPWQVSRLAFIAVEHEPPFPTSFIELDPTVWAAGEELAESALEIWAQCEVTGTWPGRSPEPVVMKMRSQRW